MPVNKTASGRLLEMPGAPYRCVMRVKAAGLTDVGRVRTGNEDAFVVRVEARVFAVADGMGGHAAGEVASRMASDTIAALEVPAPATAEALRQGLLRAVTTANHAILYDGERQPERAGMGTTLTAIAITADCREVACAHIGDSRLYLMRGGRLTQLTHDHTWVQDQVDSGTLTTVQARAHPLASVLTRSLGSFDDVMIDSFTAPVEPGDRYVLCTDGLTGLISDELVLKTVAQASTPDGACRLLIAAANEAGGRDNITAIVVDVSAE